MFRKILGMLLALVALGLPSRAQEKSNLNGEVLYRQRCASCHEAGVPRAADRAALGRMSPENIRLALTNGSMRAQGANLTPAQIDALSHFLTGQVPAKGQLSTDNRCPASGALFAEPFTQPHWNGWGGNPSQHRFQPAAMAQLRADQVPKLRLKWAFGFPGVGQAYAQPTVVGGRIFVGSAGRKVYSLSADSGCVYWVFDADFPVRTAISVGPNGQGWSAYFGDQHANAYAVDAVTGKLLWKTHVEEHPAAIITGAPTLAGGRLYVPVSSFEEVTGADPKYECCKFRGSVSALDASTGKILWKGYTIAEEPRPVRKNKQGVQLWGPSGAAVWSSPTVDLQKHRVYVTTGDSYSDPPAGASDAFLAFDMKTGKLAWSRQMTQGDAFTIDCGWPAPLRTNCPEAHGPDFDFGSSPILVDLPIGSQSGGRTLRAQTGDGRGRLAHAASRLRRPARLQSCAIGGGDRDSGRGLFGWARRPFASVFRRKRADHLGRGYPAGIPDGQRSKG